MFKHLFFILLLVGSGYYFWTTRPVTHGPGVVAPTEPTQRHAFGVQEIEYKSYSIDPLAEFTIEARVLSKKKYSDKMAEVAPYDFVLGWGPMSDERTLNEILIRQSDRYYHWEMTKPPIPQPEMVKHSANIHMAPSSQNISDMMEKVRQGHIVRIKGYLVKIDSDNGWSVKSSLSRGDYGKKASEVLWIKEFTIL